MDESKTSAIKSTQDMIILTNLRKQYGDFVAVENTTLNVKKGEFLTFLGSSGCGKTTTLRMIAGFEDPTEGSILIGGKHAPSTKQKRSQHRIPELRVIPSSYYPGKHRIRSEITKGKESRDQGKGREHYQTGKTGRTCG